MIVMLTSPNTPTPSSRISIIANRSFTKERSFTNVTKFVRAIKEVFDF